jgi:hypothetical protein
MTPIVSTFLDNGRQLRALLVPQLWLLLLRLPWQETTRKLARRPHSIIAGFA